MVFLAGMVSGFILLENTGMFVKEIKNHCELSLTDLKCDYLKPIDIQL